jgi:hypothetical protein
MREKFPGNEASANQLKLIDGKMRRRNVVSLFYYKEIIKKIRKYGRTSIGSKLV